MRWIFQNTVHNRTFLYWLSTLLHKILSTVIEWCMCNWQHFHASIFGGCMLPKDYITRPAFSAHADTQCPDVLQELIELMATLLQLFTSVTSHNTFIELPTKVATVGGFVSVQNSSHQRDSMLQITTYRQSCNFIVAKCSIKGSFSISLCFTTYNIFLSPIFKHWKLYFGTLMFSEAQIPHILSLWNKSLIQNQQ